MGPPYGKLLIQASHIFRDSNMGVVWVLSMGPAYHFRGSHVLGGPGPKSLDDSLIQLGNSKKAGSFCAICLPDFLDFTLW